VLCVLFALVGLLPPAAGALTRWTPVRDWAAVETARVIHEQLGLDASYTVRLSLWPLALELEDVTLRAKGGGPPVLETPRLSIRPRLFSLLAMRVDAGQISVESPRVQLRVADGKLSNLELHLPEGAGSGRVPLESLAITDAHIVAEIDGTRIDSDGLDLDVFAEAGSAWEVALRAGITRVRSERHLAGAEPDARAVDEDVLCQTDARVRIEPGALLVRRLSLLGLLDQSPAAGSEPSCEVENVKENASRLLMRLSSLRLEHAAGELRQATGHVLLQAPLDVAGRYMHTKPFSGASSVPATPTGTCCSRT
jgi:translocation and assembly module TamB